MTLYINGNEVELSEELDIKFTYQDSDTTTPSTVKNSFSKSIVITGTRQNNKLFGEIWKLDRVLTNDFDSRKRAEFVVMDNVTVIERGYIKLDSITSQNNTIKYNCTLYGTLGDFFYNLMYDDNGESRTLADLKYNFINLSGDVIDNGVLLKWDTEDIVKSWGKLRNWKKTDMTPHNWITAIPTYSGVYENFDNNKVAINRASVLDNTNVNSVLPLTQFSDNKVYMGYNDDGFSLVEMDRDIIEWENKQLCSHYQRTAVKFQLICDAICNKDNNGGYNVIFDESITSTEYYRKGYVMFDRFNLGDDFESVLTTSDNKNIYATPTTVSGNTFITNNNGKKYYDTTYMDNAKMTIAFKPYITPQQSDLNLIRNGNPVYINSADIKYYNQNMWAYTTYSGFLVRVTSYDNNKKYADSGYYIITSNLFQVYNKDSVIAPNGIVVNKVDVYDQYIKKYITNGADYQLVTTTFNTVKDDNVYGDENFTYTINLPKGTDKANIKVKYEYFQIGYDVFGDIVDRNNQKYIIRDGNNYVVNTFGKLGMATTSDGYNYVTNSLYDGELPLNNFNTYITKERLFGKTKSPYEYLIGFTKMINGKYVVDPPTKTITIMSSARYFENKTILDLTDKIDKSKAITIKPTNIQYKWYNWELETPDSYASYLYNKTTSLPFGAYHQSTQWEFNNDTNNLFDGVIYKNTLPYSIASQLGSTSAIPAFIRQNVVKYKMFNLTDSTDNKVIDRNGMMVSTFFDKSELTLPLPCCFDKDNNNMSEIDNAFLLLTDNMEFSDKVMMYDMSNFILNANDGNACHLYTQSNNSLSGDKIAETLKSLPRFTQTTNKNSLYFNSVDTDKYKYIDDISTKTLYYHYWENTIKQMFDDNVSTVECYVVLPTNTTPREALRRYFYFDNCIWVLNKITDFEPSKPFKTVKCLFTKITDATTYGGNK